jgi:NAD(P)-dependent dehydrogenase (short-subunit alcohol dehydrogenase family)
MQTMTTEHPRVVIVTGGSGGIGSEVAQRLARDGMSVLVAYAGRKAPAEDVVSAIVEAGGMATSFQADVAEQSDVAALFDAAELNYGGVDVVVNAAGIMLLSPLIDPRHGGVRQNGPNQPAWHVRRRSRGGAPRSAGRRHHQLLIVGAENCPSQLHGVCGNKGRC